MLCRWMNIWRSIVPPCPGSNIPRMLLDNRKSQIFEKSITIYPATQRHNP